MATSCMYPVAGLDLNRVLGPLVIAAQRNGAGTPVYLANKQV